MLRGVTAAAVVSTISSTVACSAPDQALDPEGECVTCADKADGGYSGADLAAILRVANEASEAELDDDVGINATAAANIVAARGSGFVSLEALDAVPYVGKTVIDALLAYGRARGYDRAWLPPQPWPATWEVWGTEAMDNTTCPLTLGSGGVCRALGACSGNTFYRRVKRTFHVDAEGRVTTAPTGSSCASMSGFSSAVPELVLGDAAEAHFGPDEFWHCVGDIRYDGSVEASIDRITVDEQCAFDHAYVNDSGTRTEVTTGDTLRFISDRAGTQHQRAEYKYVANQTFTTLRCDLDGTYDVGGAITCHLKVPSQGIDAEISGTFESLVTHPAFGLDSWRSDPRETYPRFMLGLEFIPSQVPGGEEQLFVRSVHYERVRNDGFFTSSMSTYEAKSSLLEAWRWGTLRTRGEVVTGGRWIGPTSSTGAPSRRTQHLAFWTGTHMLVWGGRHQNEFRIASGGLYDPETDRWTATSLDGAPALQSGRAVWTGDRLLVRGARLTEGSAPRASLYEYRPSTDTWSTREAPGAPPPRHLESMIWTGSEVIVWGGRDESAGVSTATGWRFRPASNTWTPIASDGAPSARFDHTAVWTGHEMLVFGGHEGTVTVAAGGARYAPETNTWRPMTMTNGPRLADRAVWAEDRLFVWGHDGVAWTYDPAGDAWTRLALPAEITVRTGVSLVWTGHHVIVWGGSYNSQTDDQVGALYEPSTGTWTPMPSDGVPAGRASHTAVWTGAEMIVWGGSDNGSYGVQSGGRFLVE